jgi:creatinine amidohydrolase
VRFGGQVSFGWLSNDFGPSGHIGDPTGSTPERGKALFEAAVAAVGASLVEVRAFTLPRG